MFALLISSAYENLNQASGLSKNKRDGITFSPVFCTFESYNRESLFVFKDYFLFGDGKPSLFQDSVPCKYPDSLSMV
jgi:hypothetical protein